ncbi:MAG: hypothetical protein GEV06_10735 [Luteitalea sp.]|nr:hypothetical protein [Luteitalea sp.]
MPVSARSSSAPLIDALLKGDEVARETAAARLAIRGNAAVRSLVTALAEASSDGQMRILGLLERIAAPSALIPASRFLRHDDPDVAIAAVNAVAVHVVSPRDRIATEAVDKLTALALDATRDDRVRVASLNALAPLEETVTAPLRARLADDASPIVRERALEERSKPHEASVAPTDLARLVEEAAGGKLPNDPDALRRHVAREAGRVPLTTLHRLIVMLREREATEADDTQRAGWLLCRATAHQALASRGSRLAVYDLRETIAQLNRRVPVGFLAALTEVGDASCIDTLASAWTTTDDSWFRQQLESAFLAVIAREGITKRHAAAKRMASHWPEAFRALWGRKKG